MVHPRFIAGVNVIEKRVSFFLIGDSTGGQTPVTIKKLSNMEDGGCASAIMALILTTLHANTLARDGNSFPNCAVNFLLFLDEGTSCSDIITTDAEGI